jgi:catalase
MATANNHASAPKLTTQAGAVVGDNQNVLTVGPQGPMAMQDVWYLEKLAHFDREVVPERRVHAKGSGAHGTLTVTHDITRYTKASMFAHVGKTTAVFQRFSVVMGERGAADAERDVRGFALKFYTDEGNWDLVGNNTPVFFVRDALKFPDFIHSQKRHPRTNLRDANMMWDFFSRHPESLHQVTILMSDRGIPRSYREMHGFGSHTFSMLNALDERFWVKFHFRCQQPLQHFTDEEAAQVIGKDRESAQKDLFENIAKGNFPRWTMQIQVMPEAEAAKCDFNPFDLTKVWPHGAYPLQDVGVLELNSNPTNYFAEVEQSAFNPANVVPGIGFSPDKMLQGRLFSYGDTQRYRLGVNHGLLAVNAPRCPFATAHRDGAMRFAHCGGAADDGFPPYQPDSFGGAEDDARFAEPPFVVSQAVMDRWNHRVDPDYHTQPRALFKLMSEEQQQRLFANIGRSLGGAKKEIQGRQVAHFRLVDPAYAAGVEKALGW